MDNIFDGTADIPGITTFEAAQKLLAAVKKRHPDLDLQLLLEDMLKKYKLWREDTSCSPIGRHLGHYKSLDVDFTAGDLDSDDIDQWRKTILQIHFYTLLLALDNNHVLQ